MAAVVAAVVVQARASSLPGQRAYPMSAYGTKRTNAPQVPYPFAGGGRRNI
jgi:hypothetical protein